MVNIEEEWYFGPNRPVALYRAARGAGAVKQASRRQQQEPPSWWANFDELHNGPRYVAVSKSAHLKGARLQGRDRMPSWYLNFLDATGEGAGYE